MTWVSTHLNNLICIDRAHIVQMNYVGYSFLQAQLDGVEQTTAITDQFTEAECVGIMAALRDRIVSGQTIIHMSEISPKVPQPMFGAAPKLEPRFSDQEYRMLLDLWMASDPWPTEEWGNELMTEVLNAEAVARGHDTVVEAYHRHQPGGSPNGVPIVHETTVDHLVDTVLMDTVQDDPIDRSPCNHSTDTVCMRATVMNHASCDLCGRPPL